MLAGGKAACQSHVSHLANKLLAASAARSWSMHPEQLQQAPIDLQCLCRSALMSQRSMTVRLKTSGAKAGTDSTAQSSLRAPGSLGKLASKPQGRRAPAPARRPSKLQPAAATLKSPPRRAAAYKDVIGVAWLYSCVAVRGMLMTRRIRQLAMQAHRWIDKALAEQHTLCGTQSGPMVVLCEAEGHTLAAGAMMRSPMSPAHKKLVRAAAIPDTPASKCANCTLVQGI